MIDAPMIETSSENEKKTENGKYISSYECDPKSCDQECLH